MYTFYYNYYVYLHWLCISTNRTLADVVIKLQKQVKQDKPFDIVVRRGHVLEDALRRVGSSSFDPSRSIVASCHQFHGVCSIVQMAPLIDTNHTHKQIHV